MKLSNAPLRPWYREPWPWLLAAGPLLVVVGSLCGAWLALKSDDGLVAVDYYKRGLLINQTLMHAAANAQSTLGATVRVADSGEVRAHMEGIANSADEAPAAIRLKLAHPADSEHELIVMLARDASGDYVGILHEQTPGRWIVTLESDGWRLPITTVAGRLREIRFGVAAGHS